MLEDSLEKAFPGILLSRDHRIDDPKNKQRAVVQIPLMARLSREGTVALGDVYVPCIALGGVTLPGRPPTGIDILVLDANGGVAAVTCLLQGKGVHAAGAKSLTTITKKLSSNSSTRNLDALTRKVRGKARGKSLTDLALSHWERATEGTIRRARERWIETLADGRVALYLAMERKPDDKPSKKSDPITPMQKLLENHSGGVLQVQTPFTSARPHGKYLEALEEPARLIWVYRRMKPA